MSGFIRQIRSSDGEPIDPPSSIGLGAGAKNYVLSPDGASDVTSTGGSSATDTTTLADLPEETKGVGVLVTQTAGSIGDYSRWDTDAIDDGDGGCNGAPEAYYKTKSGYVDGAASIRWINTATSEVLYTQVINAGSGRISKGVADLVLTATENIEPEVYWNVTSETNGLVVSGMGTLAETRLVGHAGWKQYDDSVVGFSNTPAGWSLSRAVFTPYKDISGNIRLHFNISSAISSATSGSVDIDGIISKNIGSYFQPVTLLGSSANREAGRALLSPNDNSITYSFPTAYTNFIAEGDIELESWPTWADFDGSVMYGTEAQAQNARGRWYRNAAYSYTASTTFAFDTEDTTTFDAALGISNSSGIFTVDEGGTYDITVSVGDNGNWAASSFIEVRVDRGSGLTRERIIGRLPTSAGVYVAGNCAIKLAGGDSFDITVSDGASVITGSSTSYIEIERRSDKSSKATGFPFADQHPGEYGMVKKVTWQTALQSSDLTTTGDIPGVKFSGLTVGNVYRYVAIFNVNMSATSDVGTFELRNTASNIIDRQVIAQADTGTNAMSLHYNHVFVAQYDSVYVNLVSITGTPTVDANNGGQLGRARLEDITTLFGEEDTGTWTTS
jgi:hypothetical protein